MASELESLKATDIPDKVLFDHLRLDPKYATEADKQAARQMCLAAVAYIQERYGVDAQYMNGHQDIAIAVLALTRDLFDNRSMTVERTTLNPVVTSILAAHDFNLI